MRSKITAKSTFYALLATSFLYLCCVYPVQLEEDFTLDIPKVKCKNAWNFMSEFKNYQRLNPELSSYDVFDESYGSRGEWKYSVKYSEYFEHLPRIFQNSAVGHYNIYQRSSDYYYIDTEHVTCMTPSFSWLCLHTSATDAFTQLKSSCHMREHIQYQCPFILIPLCKAELNSQRTKVMGNLLVFLTELLIE